MFPDQSSSMPSTSVSSHGRLESIAFYTLLVTVILAPLAFLPTQYIATDLVKAVIIAAGTLISAAIYLVIAIKERTLTLPSKAISWTALLIAVSLIASAIVSGSPDRSFFGKGFEATTVSFILMLFVAAWVAFNAIRQRAERAIVLYIGFIASFIVLYLFHALRVIFGQGFASFGILNNLNSTVLGNWYELGIFALCISLIMMAALIFLPLSRARRIAYSALLIVAGIGAFLINSNVAWLSFAIISFGMSVHLFSKTPRTGNGLSGFVRRISWLPAISFVIAVIMAWQGVSIAGPIIKKMQMQNFELALPWQMTLDVASGSAKSNLLFGVGPNRFSQAFLANKPDGINQSDAWGVEFNYGFGWLPSFVVTEGLIGIVLWIVFLIVFGWLGYRSLRRLPEESHKRFIIVSSYSAAAFLWIVSVLYVPSHSLLLYMFVLTGIWAGASTAYGSLSSVVWKPVSLGKGAKLMMPALIALIVIAGLWGFVYAKKTIALYYFGTGIKEFTVTNDPVKADAAFSTALHFDSADIYWQGRSEAMLGEANNLLSSASSATSTAAAQNIVANVGALINQAATFAQKAIAYDPTNYYNYVSVARVSEAATTLKMQNGYENAVKSYSTAIALNPQNPSLYLNLAHLQASQNKLDDALKTIGSSLQVKNNYLDAIFLLSQVEAAKGNLKDAITAAQVAIQINPSNPLFFFQLGLLAYNNKDYAGAALALAQAVKLQPDYANAQYFLGLADVQLNKTSDAIVQFEQLYATNPDSQEVAFILSNLKAGKSPFTNAQPPVTSAPEKRSALPIKEKVRK